MLQRLAISDMLKAAAMGAAVTLMSVPRIIEGGMELGMTLPVAFAAMMLISLAAVSWGHRAGMQGVFPERGRMLVGIGLAGLIGLVITWISTFWLDPVLREAMERAGRQDLVALRYPDSEMGRLALVLWAAGFETMFFQVGTLAFFSRLTNHQWIIILGAVAFRSFVTSLQIYQAGIVDGVWLFILISAVTSALGCMLYVRSGLPAAMLFSAMLSLRVSDAFLWAE